MLLRKSRIFFTFSTVRTEHLQNLIKKYEHGRIKCTLMSVALDRLAELIVLMCLKNFLSAVEPLEYFSVNAVPQLTEALASRPKLC